MSCLTENHVTLPYHGPDDFLLGLLSGHVSFNTGDIAGHCLIKEGDEVVFSQENDIYRKFITEQFFDINTLLTDWRVAKVVESEQCGYCGILYINEETGHLVLAHRPTNFNLSLKTKNLYR